MKIDIQYHYYDNGKKIPTQTRTEEWVETDWFCSNCGEQSVMKCTTNNDTDWGDLYVCMACYREFHWPYEPRRAEGGEWPQLIKKLRK